MQLGIWCDYGFTLEPSEGIGVFVDNLARGLVRADDRVRVLLVAHPGQDHLLASTVRAGLGRIEVAARPKQSRFARRAIRTCTKLRRLVERIQAHSPRAQSCRGAWLDQSLARVVARLEMQQRRVLEAHEMSCDLWLVPYVGLDRQFQRPTVVVIHDLVCYHFADVMKFRKLQHLKRLVDQMSSSATLVTCMSNFIRDNDLFRMLKLPPEKVRVIPPAVPDDLGIEFPSKVDSACNGADMLSVSAKGSLNFAATPNYSESCKFSSPKPAQVRFVEPYLFYPAAFRTYKNHKFLVALLSELKARNKPPMKLVFTGIRSVPSWLNAVIDEHDARNDVVVLGKVSRQELVQLYSHAFATVVPSLYEQGSFPILEALACQCPVAAADIPSLREQFHAMGLSMKYFNPHHPETLIPILETIFANRETFIKEQQSAFSLVRAHTWEKAAKHWLHVFQEAITLAQGSSASTSSRQAA